MPRMSRSIRVAPECLPKVRQALRLHGFPSQHALAIEIGLSRATITSFFTGKRVDYLNFVEISEKLGLEWQAIAYIEQDSLIQVEAVPLSDTSPQEEAKKKGLGIDWRQVCRAMLEAQNQRRLTTNPLTAGDGVAFELDEIYVPLGLVERKQRDRRSSDVSPEQGSRIYEPATSDEIIKTFQQDEFFEQVLRQGRSQRIAIIGEPGAGKTTLLQKIAAWVLDNTSDVPIWISLADLQGKSLEQYILSDWLKAATRKVRVTEEMQEALGELFNSGRVWLLLDAVDEMAVEVQSFAPLQLIANQITGWVADARVVLTCRLNVWDAGKNALEAFETYRNLDFSYGDTQLPNQVGQFIKRWFKSKPELAERLRAELDQPGRERIKDAVKNPLRLALLCRAWTLGQGGLPHTKAGLYQQFTEALYEWKQERFPTSSRQRQELNKALGELALRAISEEKTKFRLRDRFVCSILGNPDEELFQLALQLGWLNQVGVAAETENLGKKVYAFFHPTFQEYLAAQAVQDWRYFLNHTLDNPTQGIYRIFEPQWKEVILLWLGREDVPYEQKEEFIKTLVEFEDGCQRFYQYRTYFLAASGIAEFENYSTASEIVAQLVKWGYGYFNIEKQQWRIFLDPLNGEAKAALVETERNTAIAALVQLISSTEDESARRQAAESLGKIDPGNQDAIAALVQLIASTQTESIRRQAAFSLGKIGSGNPEAIATLVQLIKSTESADTRRLAAFSLEKIGKGAPEAIATLVQLISSPRDIYIRRQVADSLVEIGKGNPIAISALVQLLESTDNDCILREVAEILGKIDPGNPKAIAVLVQLLESTDRDDILDAAETLGTLDPGNPEAISALVQLIESTKDDYSLREAAESLVKIDPGNQKAVSTLVQLIESTTTEDAFIVEQAAFWVWKQYGKEISEASAALVQRLKSAEVESVRRETARSLGTIGKDNLEAIATLVQLIESTENEYTRLQAAKSLGRIDPGNQDAIAVLTQYIKSTKDENFLYEAAKSLGEIDPGNQDAITALVQLLKSTDDDYNLRRVAESLGKIGSGNPEAIAALVQLIKSTTDESTLKQGADSLKRILRNSQMGGVVTALKDYLSAKTYDQDFEQYYECYKLIWHCAQNMTYPAFYQAWHNQPTSTHPEILETDTANSNAFTHSLSLAELPQTLATAIANDPTLNQAIHPICIDGSKFIDRDNPATKIYTEMVKSGCPKCEDGTPKTMQELQAYWDLLDTDKRVVLGFYENTGFSETFLNALSKFDGAICVITTQPIDNSPLQWFSPNQAIADVVDWLKKVALEA